MAADGLDVTVALGGRPFPEVPFRGVQVVAAAPCGDRRRGLFDAPRRTRRTPGRRSVAQRRRDALLDASPRCRSGRPPDRAFSLRPAAVRVRAYAAAGSRPRLDAAAQVACSVRDVLVASQAARTRGGDRRADPPLLRCRARARRSGASSRSARPSGSRRDRRPDPLHRLCRRRHRRWLRQLGGQGRGARLGRRRCGRRATPLRSGRGAPADGPRRSSLALPDRAEPSRRRLRAPRAARGRHARSSSASGPISRRGSGLPRCRSRRPATTRPWTSCHRARAAVVVPYETRGETEQRLRADILARSGLLTVVPEAELSPERLAAAIAAGACKPPPPCGRNRPFRRGGDRPAVFMSLPRGGCDNTNDDMVSVSLYGDCMGGYSVAP